MTFIQQLLLYFCTLVCVLYLVSGGCKAIRSWWQKKIDERAAEKIIAGQQAAAPKDPTLP